MYASQVGSVSESVVLLFLIRAFVWVFFKLLGSLHRISGPFVRMATKGPSNCLDYCIGRPAGKGLETGQLIIGDGSSNRRQ
jgi:hypothetical protein